MNNTILIIKAHLINSFRINKILKPSSPAEKIKTALIGILMLFVFLMVLFQMFFYAHAMSGFLMQIGALEVLLIIAASMAMVVCLFMSIYKGTSYLFAFKDFDLLMSLPIKPSSVLMSKVLLMYSSNFFISLAIGIPYLIEYGIKTGSGAGFYILSVLIMIFVPLVPMTIGSAVSLFLGRLSAKHRASNIILLVGTFALVIALYAGMYSLNSVSKDQVTDFALFVASVKSIYFPFGLFINATADLNLLSFALFVGISGGVFALFIRLFGKSFKSINARMSEKYKASNYKMTSLKVSAPFRSIYIKELNFYFSSYIYVLNTAFGSVMMFILAIVLLFINRDFLIQVASALPTTVSIPVILTLGFSACCAVTCTTAPSVSLEGKNLWILKSLPIKTMDIFKSKILVNLTIVVPVLVISSIIIAFSLSFSILDYMLFILITLSYNALMAMLGLIVNLYLPKLEWKTQVAVVKQSASVVVAMAMGVISVVLPIAALVLIKPKSMLLFQIVLLFGICAINFGQYTFLKTRGVELFNRL